MTNTARTLKNHSNIWTVCLLALAAYMLWPVLTGEVADRDAPHEQTEVQNNENG